MLKWTSKSKKNKLDTSAHLTNTKNEYMKQIENEVAASRIEKAKNDLEYLKSKGWL